MFDTNYYCISGSLGLLILTSFFSIFCIPIEYATCSFIGVELASSLAWYDLGDMQHRCLLHCIKLRCDDQRCRSVSRIIVSFNDRAFIVYHYKLDIMELAAQDVTLSSEHSEHLFATVQSSLVHSIMHDY